MEIKKIDKGQMFLSPTNFKVKVRFGRIWMTIEGDSEDYILNSVFLDAI